MEGGTAAARLAAAIATAAHAHRGLRRARAQLQVDLAAVLGGLRPSAMLDYVVVPADAVAALVCELAEPGGAPLLVGEWGGCCYVVRPDLVLARGASAEHGPRLAAFDVTARDGGGHTATCRWAAPAEAAGFCTGLAPVLAAVQAASRTGVILRLGAVAGAPLMPSLNGWLLGYPVVYLVDEDNVDAAAEALSHAPLLLVRAMVVPPGACETKPAAVASFTVPAALVGAGEQGADAPCLAAWLAEMQAAACASALWASGQPLRLDVSVVSCRVAL